MFLVHYLIDHRNIFTTLQDSHQSGSQFSSYGESKNQIFFYVLSCSPSELGARQVSGKTPCARLAKT